MKSVVEIVAAVILLASGGYLAPKMVSEFKKETIKKVDHGLSPLAPFASQLSKK
jgi:hypothetical protein